MKHVHQEINIYYAQTLKSDVDLDKINKLSTPQEIFAIMRKTKGKKTPGFDGKSKKLF